MECTCQTRQPDLPVSPGEFFCNWQVSLEEETNSDSFQEAAPQDAPPLEIVQSLHSDEDSSQPEAQPETGKSAAEPVSAAQEEEDLLIIPLRPADRRAEDFLPGWVRRFSRG